MTICFPFSRDVEVPKTWEDPSDYVEKTDSSKNHDKDAIVSKD